MNVLAVILAAGFSRRMGENKLFLEYQKKTFIQIIIDKLLEVDFKEIILVVSSLEIYKKYEKYNKKVSVVFNDRAENGISESIKKAVTYAEKNLKKKEIFIDRYMFFVADQPLLKKDTIFKILKEAKSDRIIVPINNDNMYNPVIFPNKYTYELLNLKGDIGGKQVILKHLDDVLFVDIQNEEELKDIDTIEEYLKLVNNK